MTDRAVHPRHAPLVGPARLIAVGLVCVVVSAVAPAQLIRPTESIEQIQGVEVVEHLGGTLPLKLRLTDSDGRSIELGELFDGERPVVLSFVYFGCPVVCPLVLERMTNSFRELDYTIGKDFRVVVISIDYTEGPTESSAAEARYTGAYGRDAATVREGWSFLTGEEETVRAIAEAAGWGYKRLRNGEYSHPTALMIASPRGKITRYIYGFDFPPKQMKLSLLDASEGKIAQSLGDHLLFYCYRYDPTAGAYSMEAMAVMRIAGGLTVVAIAALIGGLFAFEKAKKKNKTGEDGRAACAA